MFLIADIETDGLYPCSKIHLFGWKDFDTGEVVTYRDVVKAPPVPEDAVWVFHNGLQFDVPVLNSFFPSLIDPSKVVDTMVVSRLVNYSKFSTHSLKELGERLGIHKGEYIGDWSTRTKEMEDYWLQDLEVGEAIFKMFLPVIKDPKWKKALRVEHDMATICFDMHKNGFCLDKERLEEVHNEVLKDMAVLEGEFQKAFPPVRKEKKRIRARRKKDGEWYGNVAKAMAEYKGMWGWSEDKREIVCYEMDHFSPGSPKKRIDVLWEAGWKPYQKTKGHMKFIRERRHYGT